MKFDGERSTTDLARVKNSACWAAAGAFALLTVGTTVLSQRALIRDWKAEELKQVLRKEKAASIIRGKTAPFPPEIRGIIVSNVENTDPLVGTYLKALDDMVPKREKAEAQKSEQGIGSCYDAGRGIMARCRMR